MNAKEKNCGVLERQKTMFVGAQDTPAEGLKKQTNLHQ